MELMKIDLNSKSLYIKVGGYCPLWKNTHVELYTR